MFNPLYMHSYFEKCRSRGLKHAVTKEALSQSIVRWQRYLTLGFNITL